MQGMSVRMPRITPTAVEYTFVARRNTNTVRGDAERDQRQRQEDARLFGGSRTAPGSGQR